MGKDKIQLMAFDMGHRLSAMFSSYAEAAKVMGVSRQAITHCAKGKKISCAGYYWREIKSDIVVSNDDLGRLTLIEYDSVAELDRDAYKPWKNGKNNIIKVNDFKTKTTKKR